MMRHALLQVGIIGHAKNIHTMQLFTGNSPENNQSQSYMLPLCLGFPK